MKDYKDLVERDRRCCDDLMADGLEEAGLLLDESAKAIEALVSRVKELEAAPELLRGSIRAIEKERDKLRADLSAAQAEIESLKDDLEDTSRKRREAQAELAEIKGQEPIGHFQFDHQWGIYSEVQEQYKDDDGVIPLYRLPIAPAKAQVPEGTRKVFICRDCRGVYVDAPTSQCDCLGSETYDEGYIVMLADAPTPKENNHG